MKYYSRFTEVLLQKPIPKSKQVFNDKKVTDHHAIIPTGIVPSGITPAEQQVYDLICKRFIAVFYPECKVSNTTVMGKVDSLDFKATGKQMIELGWREVYQDDTAKKKDKNEEKIMPVFEEGESGPHEPFIHQGKTSPPKPYTEATLLRAMESAGKQVDDEEMRELLKDNGIGRPSTRANIIETLFRRKYIEKKRKNLVPTATGMGLIGTIQNEVLKSPELTGDWEKKLRLIEKGEYESDVFKKELFLMVRELCDEVIFSNYRPINILQEPAEPTKKERKPRAKKEKVILEELDCPKCKKAKIMKGKTAIGCYDYKTCGFKIPFELLGKKLTENQMISLLQKGKTGTIKGFVIPGNAEPKNGKLILDEGFNVGLG